MGPAEIVEEVFAAFAARDVARLQAVCDPECTFWPQGTAERVGRAEPYLGRDGLVAYFADLDRVWSAIDLEFGTFRVAGGGVVVFGRVVGRLVEADAEVDIPVIWVYQVRNGLVVSIRAVATVAEADALIQGP